MIRHASIALAFTAALATAGFGARPQEFPNRSIGILLGLAAGGITDVTTRQYAEFVSKSIGQSIVIENRTGAGGAIAAAAVQNAQTDGHTLLSVVGSQFASVPAMGTTSYDPVKGIRPDNPAVPIADAARRPLQQPGKVGGRAACIGTDQAWGFLSPGSPGAGSPGHLLAALISMGTKTPMQYVHYRGGAPIMADLISERLDFGLWRRITALDPISMPSNCVRSCGRCRRPPACSAGCSNPERSGAWRSTPSETGAACSLRQQPRKPSLRS